MRIFASLICLMLAIACSPAPPGVTVHDPYEDRNRRAHAFNKGINDALSGASDDQNPKNQEHGDQARAEQERGDSPLVHPDISNSVINFADNLGGPSMVLNGLLQGNIGSAATNAFRFVLNTTVGVGGLLDPADAIGLPEVETDFGQTLAVWGVAEGAYLELPLLGPATERDLAGQIVDALIDPLAPYLTTNEALIATGAEISAQLLKRDQFGDTIDGVLNESADSYAQTRLIYLQNRRFELGLAPVEAIDPYADLYGE